MLCSKPSWRLLIKTFCSLSRASPNSLCASKALRISSVTRLDVASICSMRSWSERRRELHISSSLPVCSNKSCRTCKLCALNSPSRRAHSPSSSCLADFSALSRKSRNRISKCSCCNLSNFSKCSVWAFLASDNADSRMLDSAASLCCQLCSWACSSKANFVSASRKAANSLRRCSLSPLLLSSTRTACAWRRSSKTLYSSSLVCMTTLAAMSCASEETLLSISVNF
mmetsp:Transcript_48555/g.89443  ORF Transcript_48555/g.89443 Transcript_48555/m.89443 type:complete len:227 (-) Transcript_48555:1212-1892(-)